MSDSTIAEISRLLSVSFSESRQIEISDLVRFWSLELQWMEPNDAQMIIDRLLKSGWLIDDNDFLRPANGIQTMMPKLGWRPIIRAISKPPEFIISDIAPQSIEIGIKDLETIVEVIQVDSKPSENIERLPDKTEDHIPKLISLISQKSKLDNREVVRRAQRKRRSLGAITLWMALALVAREQGLDMIEIVEVIESV
jgi:hypothetical protein